MVLALECLHSNGKAYGDLSLKHVLMDKEGYICLSNFTSKSLRTLQKYNVLWLPEYAPPEAFWPLYVDEFEGKAGDWYSLGTCV